MVDAPEAEARPSRRAPWKILAVLLDAVVFLVVVYGAIGLRLQAGDGVIPMAEGRRAVAVASLVLLALAWGNRRLWGLDRSHSLVTFVESLLVIATIVFLGRLGARAPSDAGNFWWLALEWTKLPDNLVLMARLSPLAAALAPVAFLAAVAALWLGGGRGRGVVAVLASVAAACIVVGLSRIGADDRVLVYWVIFAGPWVAGAVASLVGLGPLAVRALLVAFLGGGMVVHYLAWLPVDRGELDELAHARRIYPPPGAEAEFPLAFLREIVVDPTAGRIFSAYGPASGIVAIDLVDGALEQHTTPNELVRHLWSEEGRPDLLALDWVQGDLLRITKDPFEIAGKRALISPTRSVPMAFEVGPERTLVTFSELPALVEIDSESARPLRELSFRDEGYTAYRSGAWAMTGDPDRGFVVVEVGAVDREGRYLLLRVDLDSWSVSHVGEVPEGGLALVDVPERDTVYAAAFFGDRIYEFDLDDLSLTDRGSVPGPLNTRVLLRHVEGDLLFALGFLSGELHVIDLEAGATRCVLRVGNKAMSLAQHPEGRWLYVGSRAGLYELDLPAILADPAHCDGLGATR